MEKLTVSKNPTLEAISEIETHAYNAGRTNYNRQQPAQVNTTVYRTSTDPLAPQTHVGRMNQGYAGSSQTSINRDSQNSVNRDGSTPSVGGYVAFELYNCASMKTFLTQNNVDFFVESIANNIGYVRSRCDVEIGRSENAFCFSFYLLYRLLFWDWWRLFH